MHNDLKWAREQGYNNEQDLMAGQLRAQRSAVRALGTLVGFGAIGLFVLGMFLAQ